VCIAASVRIQKSATWLCYNPLFASNSLSNNVLGVPGLKRTLTALFVSILIGAGLVSCGGSSSRQTTSGLAFRVFVSNPVNLSFTGGNVPALNIIDATHDMLSPFRVSLAGAVANAGMMIETPKRDRTI